MNPYYNFMKYIQNKGGDEETSLKLAKGQIEANNDFTSKDLLEWG